MRNEGRGYTFCDRFAAEFLYIMTQTVDPAIVNETDPQKILGMFTTKLEVRARMHIIKSLSLLKGKILAESEKSLHETC